MRVGGRLIGKKELSGRVEGEEKRSGGMLRIIKIFKKLCQTQQQEYLRNKAKYNRM